MLRLNNIKFTYYLRLYAFTYIENFFALFAASNKMSGETNVTSGKGSDCVDGENKRKRGDNVKKKSEKEKRNIELTNRVAEIKEKLADIERRRVEAIKADIAKRDVERALEGYVWKV